MASPFSRTLRSLEADGHRRSLFALVPALLFFGAWSAWFLTAKVVLYETAETAWLAAEREAHPIAAPVGGRVSAVRAAISQRVKAGDVLPMHPFKSALILLPSECLLLESALNQPR